MLSQQSSDLCEQLTDQFAPFREDAPRGSTRLLDFVSKTDAVAFDPQSAPAGRIAFEWLDVAAWMRATGVVKSG